MMNTGPKAVTSQNGLLTTIAYRLDGQTTYALEGSIFIAGAAVQWLRDKLELFDSAAQTEDLAASLDSNEDVYLVPAFVGLGAPYWNPHARGALFGLTRDTGAAQITRAALESVCYQTHDLVQAMCMDADVTPQTIKIDGGMVNNNWLCQNLADVLDMHIERPTITETTALGAAYLAGLQVGIFASTEALTSKWRLDKAFAADMSTDQRQRLLKRWHQAVDAVNRMSSVT
jgi:glycerol kinase